MTDAPTPRRQLLTAFLAKLRSQDTLSRAHRLTLNQQATILLESIYAHLPFKRAMFGIDPIQQLRYQRLQLLDPKSPPRPDCEFHEEMVQVFDAVRDIHTVYHLPEPYAGRNACLPVVIERYGPEVAERYLVTSVIEPRACVRLRRGDEVTHWNGTPIARLVSRRAETQPGSNRAAQRSMAVRTLTIRSLGLMRPPDEEWVDLTCLDGRGERYTERLRWEVRPTSAAGGWRENDAGEVIPRSVDPRGESVRRARAPLTAAAEAPPGRASIWVRTFPVRQEFAELLRAGVVELDGQECGYLRIFSFSVPVIDGERAVVPFVEEVAGLLARMPTRRTTEKPEATLILDLRGNPGGHIPAAERLLQLFRCDEKQRITPEPGQFLTSSLMFDFMDALDDGREAERERRMSRALRHAMEVGALYSRGFPVTPAKQCNDRGVAYEGKTVLVVNAASTSAADVFAAGFQDHGIGPILGTSPTTGGAGAQMMSHTNLRGTFDRRARDGGPPSPLLRLPGGVSMTVAFRRMVRVGETVRPGDGEGDRVDVPLEGLGVRADYVCTMTRDDLLYRNVDLIRNAHAALRHWTSLGPADRRTLRDAEIPTRVEDVRAAAAGA
jgi:hypothetical protein